MVRKKMEGDEEQRRAAAREAERAGERPSARGATTGASKQRAHMTDSLTHEEKQASLGQGKQQAAKGPAGEKPAPAQEPERTFRKRGHVKYSDAHEQVLRALSEAEVAHAGEGVHLDEISRAVDLTEEETRELLHDLVATHGLVTELQGTDSPDMGPRYESKPRL